MCEDYRPCVGTRLEVKKALTLLLLDCWQREYDQRPYRNFRFNRTDFEERLDRDFHPVNDIAVVVRFLQERSLCQISLLGLRMIECQHKLLRDFVESLFPLCVIELKLMELPAKFYKLLHVNVARLRVQELSLEGTPLTTEDLFALRKFLIESKTLRNLNLNSCGINQSNFALLGDGIQKSTSIRGLHCNGLLGNTLTLDSIKITHTVSSLIWPNKLEEIEMQHCEFTAQDMEIIAEYLWRRNSKLLKLNLGYNIIACDGAEYLLRAIAHSGTLTHLDISANGLGTHGGEVVSRYLSACYRLEYLNIGYNQIGCEAINDILTTIKKPLKLQLLQLYGNCFNRRSANILRRLLDARVVPQETIDITFTFDEVLQDYRVIPCR